VATGRVLCVFEGPARLSHAAVPMVLSRDDRTLATGNDDHSIFLWDVSEAKLREVNDEAKRHAERVRKTQTRVAGGAAQAHPARALGPGDGDGLPPDGKTLASASMDGTIKISRS
jgi:WD40 repeat protein